MTGNGRCLLLFMHIPKAAGTTLHRIIERQYRPFDIISIHGEKGIQRARKLPESVRAKMQVAKGHMTFGAHTCFPQPAAYFTLLRHPVSRAISHYQCALRRGRGHLYDTLKANHMDLDACLRGGHALDLENLQTKWLTGLFPESETDPSVFRSQEAEKLTEARQNLREHFLVVGLSERFDETLLILKKQFGWKHVFYTRLNVAPHRTGPEPISDETRLLIERCNQLDMALYHDAQGRFEKTVAEQGPSFQKEVEEFRHLNQRYERLYRIWAIYSRWTQKTVDWLRLATTLLR
ncbi:MAG: sulfotransferase family 2 domain-containing protein [Chloroflexaceae bacterium]|nr:sulfotransferase family 2 domain-containing protein [Chloroflexaceae bacterium]